MASCAFVLTLGKRWMGLAPSSYKTCITPTQAKKLFGTTTRPRPLGCGVFACVFEHTDPRKIVKITRDPSDVAGLLQGQGLAQVPKVYASHKLVGRPWWTTPRVKTESWQTWPDRPEAFALVIEKLRVFSGAEKSKWAKRIFRLRHLQKQADEKCKSAASGATTIPLLPEGRKTCAKLGRSGDLAKAVCPKNPRAEAKDCYTHMMQLIAIRAALAKRGIDWTDVHAGNIGVDKNGRWKVLDLGASTTRLTVEPPELAGRRR